MTRLAIMQALVNAAKPKQTLLSYFGRSQPPPPRPVAPGNLLPTAACFQTTLQQTLTCTSCSYSRPISETFRELSLDFPPLSVRTPRPLVCSCRKPPVLLTVKKEGANHGRQFVKCGQPVNPCKFFEWQDCPPLAPLALTQLLTEHFKPRKVDITCEKCPHGKQATMTCHIQSLPPVLVLHLKRFEVQHATLTKRVDAVDTPVTLDPSTWPLAGIASKPTDRLATTHVPTPLYQLKVDATQVLQGHGAKSGYLLVYVQRDLVLRRSVQASAPHAE
ncbi:hypothetical protein DYB30_003604 [Aphanomyces astaci]|nr:hypothetical protein DYB30_003604 [Aphanomyces astaci]